MKKRSRDCDTFPAASAQTFGGRVRISHQRRSAAIIVGQFFSLSRISKSLLSIFLTFSFYLDSGVAASDIGGGGCSLRKTKKMVETNLVTVRLSTLARNVSENI